MIRTTQELMQDIGQAARARRLAANLAQTGLEQRSGVSLGSIKSFERSGKISLEALLKIAMALGAADAFEALFKAGAAASQLALDDLLKAPKTRRRGRVR